MNKYLELANQIHQNNPVVDTHLDLAAEIYWRNKCGETKIIENLYLPKLKEGGVNIVVSSIFIENSFLPEHGMEMMMNQVEALKNDIELSKDKVMLIKTKDDLNFAIKNNKLGIILYCEGLDQIGHDISKLKTFFDLGVRGASLTWSRKDELAQGCCPLSMHEDWKGHLTEYGIQAVHELEKLGMFLDVSHLNDDGFEDLYNASHAPFLATHSNSRVVHDSYRNLKDDQIQRLSLRGGIMGLNGCLGIVGVKETDSNEVMISKMADHLEYIINLVGESHCGFGFDFCDSYYRASSKANKTNQHVRDDCLLDSYAQIPEITAELLKRGYTKDVVCKIIGGNYIEYFSKMLPSK